MQPLSAHQLAAILGVSVAAGSPDVVASGGVTTDTRKLPDGAVFFALRGPTFDGDGFAAAALAGGARVAVVHAWNGPAP
ncbi:MAG: Mur ligase domain-containing protein, partial [Verrucomicrobiota bacterium]